MLTRAGAINQFVSEVMPSIRTEYERDRLPDYPARSEGWNNFVDALVTEGKAPERAYHWKHPRCCYAPWETRA